MSQLFLILGVPPPGGVCAGLVAPAALDLGAPPQVPRGVCAGLVAPASPDLGAPPQTPGDFRFTTKVTKGVSGGAPLNPLGGHYHPPSGTTLRGVAAPPRKGFRHKNRPICHFGLVGKSVFFLPKLYRGSHFPFSIRGTAGMPRGGSVKNFSQNGLQTLA